MTNFEHITVHIAGARPHYYHHTSGSHGHLSGGAAVAVIVLLVLIAIGYGVYKMNTSDS